MLLGQEQSGGPIQGFNAFAAGASIVILATALLPELVYGLISQQLPRLQPHLPGVAGSAQLLAFLGDGALAGMVLGVRGSQALGFGAGFMVAGYFAQKTLFYLRFFPASQSPLEAVIYSACLLGLGFGLAGVACGLATGRGRPVMLRAGVGFALGGGLGGILLTLPLWIPASILASGWDRLAATVATPASLLVPHMVGGAALGSALQQQASPSQTTH